MSVDAGRIPHAVLDGSASLKKVKAYLADCTKARLAVAYWGKGAVGRLGLPDLARRDAEVQIVCDLMSGGCNPGEVRKLLDLFGPDQVRARDKLHAKVWITDVGCVLGSSNASANGHGHEGDETSGLIEANLAFDAPAAVEMASWETWFAEKAWLGSVLIDEDLLEQATALWKWRRSGRDGPSSTPERRDQSLLDKLRIDPDYFADKPITLYVYETRHLEGEEVSGVEDELCGNLGDAAVRRRGLTCGRGPRSRLGR